MLRLLDVNGDGRDDVIFGVAQPSNGKHYIQQPEYCQQYKRGCMGKMCDSHPTTFAGPNLQDQIAEPINDNLYMLAL